MTLVTANETRGVRRIMAISGGTGFILAIAASRLLLHAHSAAEVGVGLVIGTAALALFGLQYPRYRAKEMWLFPLFVACGALVTVLHGRELRAEEFLREMAGYLRIHCG
jgi:membrane-associated phospholipid phosphatase